MSIKEIIKQWLFKEELEELKSLKHKYDALYKETIESNRKLGNAEAKFSQAYDMCDKTQKLMNQITDVAVDVGFRGIEHSWAVVCIKGKIEYVKFVPLNHADAMELRNFLKHFQYSQRIVDSPLAWKAMIGRDLFIERQRW